MKEKKRFKEILTVHPDDATKHDIKVERPKYSRDRRNYLEYFPNYLKDRPEYDVLNLLDCNITVPMGFSKLLSIMAGREGQGYLKEKFHQDRLALVLHLIWVRRRSNDKGGWNDYPKGKIRWIAHDWFQQYLVPLNLGTDKGPLVDYLESDHSKHQARKIKISDHYKERASEYYEVQSPDVKNRLFKHRSDSLKFIQNDEACMQLIRNYRFLKFPTLEEVEDQGKKLSRKGKGDKTALCKKGKVFIRLNKRTKRSFLKQCGWFVTDMDNKEVIAFFKERYYCYEDHIKLYKDFLMSGLRLPHRQKRSHRVDDSITGLPEWIRNLIKVGDEEMVEVDCTALHLNIPYALADVSPQARAAFLEQSGDMHSRIAEYLGMSRTEVKVEALSYQNKRWSDMEKSIIHPYYQDPKIGIQEYSEWLKETKKFGHKHTSWILFQYEVKVIWAAMAECRRRGIVVYQVFDAIGCLMNKKSEVSKILNETLRRFNVPTCIT